MAAHGYVSSEGGRFGIVPEWVVAATEPQALRLYCWLAARYADRDGIAYPSRARLARELTITTKTVDRALASLEASGALSVERRRSDGGDSDTNLYRLHRIKPDGATPMSLGGDTSVATGRDMDVATGRDTSVPQTRVPQEPEPNEPEEPSWVVTLKSLEGYRSHPKQLTDIATACSGAGADPLDVAKSFAEYWPIGRIRHAWRDPVAALSRTIDLQIRKARAGGSPGASATMDAKGWAALKADERFNQPGGDA